MLKNFFSNGFFLIVIDIILGSLMALFGILAYGKTKKISSLFFVLSAFFLYLIMVFRVLEKLNLFMISDYLIFNLPLFYFILNYLPFIFMITGFVIIMHVEK